MKKITLQLLLFLFAVSTKAQIVDSNSGVTTMDAPTGTYIADLNDTFTPFLGTWRYQNGSVILTVLLEKVTHYYNSQYGNYRDFIKGNYSYTTDNGLHYITNTIYTNLLVDQPNINSFYSSGPTNPQEMLMAFRDEFYNKSCFAEFKFLSANTTQITMKLINKGGGYVASEIPPNPDFSIPNNVVLTKID